MAVSTNNVVGKVVTPDGVGATAGTVVFKLSKPGSVPDGATDVVVLATVSGSIAATGDVDLDIVPNDTITPDDTYYTVELDVTAPVRDYQKFRTTVPSTPNPVDIGALDQLLETPSGLVVFTVSGAQLVVASLPAPTSALLGRTALLNTGSGETASYTCHRTATGSYQWVYSGGSSTSSAIVAALPTPSSEYLGVTLTVDTGSGETYAATCQRDAADAYGWIMAGNGGE